MEEGENWGGGREEARGREKENSGKGEGKHE